MSFKPMAGHVVHRSLADGNFVMTGAGKLIEVQMSAEGSTFTRNEMSTLLDLAEKGVGELVTAQKAAAA
jgi:ribonuclease PH